MKHLRTFESWETPFDNSVEESWGMGKEEMMEYLCRCGYPLRDLMIKDEEELHMMCMETGQQNMQEKKKWIQDTKMKKGALHKQLGYGEDETIPAGIIKKIVDGEVGSKVKIKDKEHTITALMKKRANLAKTLKKLK
jgi:hypothetical protein